MIDSPETLRIIESAALLRDVSRELLDPLLRKAKLIKLKPGEKILSPGKINENVYIVTSGRLNVQVSQSPSAEVIATLLPGDCVGEMSVLVDGLVSAYVVAATPSELFVIDYTQFWSLIDGSNKAARNMLNILVHRIRLGNEVVADNLMHRDNFPNKELFDSLTGLYNYHGMHEKFDRLFRRSMVDGGPLSIVVLEVDEPENADRDGSGESSGDQPLRNLAQTMLAFLRPDDHAARLIGGKFAVLLVNASLSDACATAERLRTAISQAPVILPNGNALAPFTISAGVSVASPDDTWNSLLDRADGAHERARSAGRNRVASA